jgi:hypothetical protein
MPVIQKYTTLPREAEGLPEAINDGVAWGYQRLDEVTRSRMTTAVYALPDSGDPAWLPCIRGECAATAEHAVEMMRPLIVAVRDSPGSDWPVDADNPDLAGLTTRIIAAVKAHSVVRTYTDNLWRFQWGQLEAGDPNSFGAVLWEIPLLADITSISRGPTMRYGVSTSGADKRDDHINSKKVALTIEEWALWSYLTLRRPAPGPFVTPRRRG